MFDIYVYQFLDNCGILDILLQASTVTLTTQRSVVFYPTPQKREYRMIGDSTMTCIFDGNWDRDPPLFEPVIQCNVEDITKNLSSAKNF